MIWFFVALSIVIIGAILFGSIVIMDYKTYWELQKRLSEEKRKKVEEENIAGYNF